ncbi:hypothetical protein JD969_14030 [Planctomycetota bacterium]|nr:hypothetical protein JD969_14030 [Planctomycetota bacterium]
MRKKQKMLKKLTTLTLATAAMTATWMLPDTTQAWHDEGHYYAAMAATQNLPDDFPAFFKDGVKTIAHLSIDPDVMKSRATPQLTNLESSEHYMDIEFIGNRKLPKTRYEFYKLCEELDLSPTKVGTAPYAITEWTQRLTTAFSEYRKSPDNPHIQMKCLIYAGILSHYSADMKMPLHTSIHHNGYVHEDGSITQKGIHAKIDSLPSKLSFNQIFKEKLAPLASEDDVFTFTVDELHKSNSYVKQAYELEPKMPATRDLDLYDKDVIAFTVDRERAAAWFTASLYLSAWENSKKMEVPFWLDRDLFDNQFDPDKVPDKQKAESAK